MKRASEARDPEAACAFEKVGEPAIWLAASPLAPPVLFGLTMRVVPLLPPSNEFWMIVTAASLVGGDRDGGAVVVPHVAGDG